VPPPGTNPTGTSSQAIEHLVVGAVAGKDVDRLDARPPFARELRRMTPVAGEHGLGIGRQGSLQPQPTLGTPLANGLT
jgi:hypothetical protein